MQLEKEVWLQQSWKTFAQLPQPPFEYSTHQSSHNNSIMETWKQQWLGTMLENHESIGVAELFTIVPGGWSCQNPILASPWWFFQERGKVMRNNTMLTIPKPNFLVSPVVSGISVSISSPKPLTKTTIWDLAKKKNTTSSVTWQWASDMGDGQSPKMPKISNPCRASPSPLVKVASSSRRCLGAYPIVQVANSRKKTSRGSPLNLSSLRWFGEWW